MPLLYVIRIFEYLIRHFKTGSNNIYYTHRYIDGVLFTLLWAILGPTTQLFTLQRSCRGGTIAWRPRTFQTRWEHNSSTYAISPLRLRRTGVNTFSIDIIQTRDYITLHIGSCIHMMLARWLSTFALSLMNFMSRKFSLLSYVKTAVAFYSWRALFNLPHSLAILALYLRSILAELDAPCTSATVIYDHKRGALLLASATQPTIQSRQIDIIFTRHVDNLTGRLPPPCIHSLS